MGSTVVWKGLAGSCFFMLSSARKLTQSPPREVPLLPPEESAGTNFSFRGRPLPGDIASEGIEAETATERPAASSGEAISPNLLAILQSPISHARLTVREGALETIERSQAAERYGIEDGIPLLLDRDLNDLDPQEQRVVHSFELFAESYYSKNYAASVSSERTARFDSVIELVRSLSPVGRLVADVGSGPAVFAEPVQSLGAGYVAIDLSLRNLLSAKRRLDHLDAIVASTTNLPVQDEAFDLVLCIGCLEYVTRPRQAIGELLRVTRTGGHVLMSFANSRSPRRWWDEGVVHPTVRLRSRFTREAAGYKRSLVSPTEAASLVSDYGGKVELVEHLGQGLLGYPLSEWGWLRDLAEHLQSRSEVALTRCSEFLLLASRHV
jgi:ubiquinone/menaquinone biosynthesis C-methylase UbiE